MFLWRNMKNIYLGTTLIMSCAGFELQDLNIHDVEQVFQYIIP